jgi:hypothetical protein
MSKTQTATMLIIAVFGWSAVAIFDWIRHYPRLQYIARMPADGSAPPLPPAIEVGPGVVRR